jgi:hypothetical protein
MEVPNANERLWSLRRAGVKRCHLLIRQHSRIEILLLELERVGAFQEHSGVRGRHDGGGFGSLDGSRATRRKHAHNEDGKTNAAA